MNNTMIKNNDSSTMMLNELKQSEKQYPVLTKAEERELINKYKDTDDAKLRKLLVMHNLRCVFSVAKKYMFTCKSFDDMIGRGLEGLCEAARRFDVDKGIKFITYAQPWVFKYIIYEYYDHGSKIDSAAISIDKPVANDESGACIDNFVNSMIDKTYNIKSMSGDIDEALQVNSRKEIVAELTKYIYNDKKFNELDREIFNRNLLDKDSLKQISADMSVSVGTANKQKKYILQEMHTFLKNNFGINSFDDI